MLSRREALFGVLLAPTAAVAQIDVKDGAYHYTCGSRPDLCETTYGEDRDDWPIEVEWVGIYLYNKQTGMNDLELGFARFGEDHGHVVWRRKLAPEPTEDKHEGYGDGR